MLESITQSAHLNTVNTTAQPKAITKIKYKSVLVHDVKFVNQTNETVVGSGAKIYGRLYLNIQPQDRHNCLRQIIVGIKDLGPQQLVFSERKIIGKRLEGFLGVDQKGKVHESYVDYPKEFQLIAPSYPGVYELEVCILELEADSVANPGTINGFFQPKAQDAQIFNSETALEQLWGKEPSCKIAMGKIRVI